MPLISTAFCTDSTLPLKKVSALATNQYRPFQNAEEVSRRIVRSLPEGPLRQLEMLAGRVERKAEEQPSQNLLPQVRRSVHGPKIQERRGGANSY